ncbi:MAG TPA: HlyD family secretion protein [Polyangiaceae bacterium]
MSQAAAEPVGTGTQAAEAPKEKAAGGNKSLRILLGIFAVGAVVGGAYYVTHMGKEDTDDAQIDAEVVPVPAKASGTVIEVKIQDNQEVKAGQVIALLDPAYPQAKLEQAEAALLSAKASASAADAQVQVTEASAKGQKSVAEASLSGAAVSVKSTAQQIAEGQAAVANAQVARDQAATDLQRAKTLFASQSISKQSLDNSQSASDGAEARLTEAKARLNVLQMSTAQAQAQVLEARGKLGQVSAVDAQIARAHAEADVAHAQVATAQAARDLAALDLSYTQILAPVDGVASKKTIAAGQLVGVGQTVVMIVPKNTWVTANFKETQVGKMKVGQPAEIEVDTFGGVKISGEIESLSGATGSRFTLLPPDNATGNYTKIVQRVPVKIKLHDVPAGVDLRPGMSVDATVDTRK